MRTRMGLAVLIAAGLASACAKATPTAPFGFSAYVPGPAPTTFAGSLQDSVGGNGSVTVSLATASGIASGTWVMSFGATAQPTRYISGSISGTTYTAEVAQCNADLGGGGTTCFPNCRLSFVGTITSTTLSGSYSEVTGDSCPAPRAGTMTATVTP